MAVAWQRVGNQLKCIEHGETFPLARRCPTCPVPGRTDRRRRKKLESSHTSELSVAAVFSEHPLATREGRIRAAIDLYEKVNAEGELSQPAMNAVKEQRMILELLESLSGSAVDEATLRDLEQSNAELLERLDGQANPEALEPPLVEPN